jgi:septum site-determining protein MinC
LQTDLEHLVQRAPGVYRGAAVVLDGTDAGMNSVSLAAIAQVVRGSGFSIAGVTGIAASIVTQAQLPTLMMGGRSTTAPPTKRAATMVVSGSVRGGQQVYGGGCGVTVLGSVHPGGEVIADGDIHVLGTLDGRALAGTLCCAC